MSVNVGTIWKRVDDVISDVVGPDGVKVAVQPDTSKVDVFAWARANPVPTVIGVGLLALVVRALIRQ